MPDPWQFISDRMDEIEQEILNLEEMLAELPAHLHHGVLVQIAQRRAKLASLRRQLRNCRSNPTPFLLHMDGIEVTQSIQDMQGSVTLITGKRTAVRVYLSYYASPDIQLPAERMDG